MKPEWESQGNSILNTAPASYQGVVDILSIDVSIEVNAYLHHVSRLVGTSLRNGARHQIRHHLPGRNHGKHHLQTHGSAIMPNF